MSKIEKSTKCRYEPFYSGKGFCILIKSLCGEFMILLIDAYNVLKQILPAEKIGQRERKEFIDSLGRYAKIRQHKVILVFDGGPYDRPTKERVSGIYVVYAGWSESADDYIKRYLKEHKSLDILLISSDRDLRNTARRCKIESVRSRDFYKTMQVALKEGASKKTKETEVIKTIAGYDEELDKIMREGSKVVHKKVEDFIAHKKSRKSKAQKPSKKERKKIKKIKKL